MRRRALDTSGLTDPGRWENLVEQVLTSPPPYRAAPGRPVYVIHAGDRAVLVGEQDLTGPLADLVETILETGGPPLAAERAARAAATALSLPILRRPGRMQRPEDASQSRKTRIGMRTRPTERKRGPAEADPCPQSMTPTAM
jgi:hypothetical protein